MTGSVVGVVGGLGALSALVRGACSCLFVSHPVFSACCLFWTLCGENCRRAVAAVAGRQVHAALLGPAAAHFRPVRGPGKRTTLPATAGGAVAGLALCAEHVGLAGPTARSGRFWVWGTFLKLGTSQLSSVRTVVLGKEGA